MSLANELTWLSLSDSHCTIRDLVSSLFELKLYELTLTETHRNSNRFDDFVESSASSK